MERAFSNRAEAGRQLAEKLETYRGREDVIVLGLPRGDHFHHLELLLDQELVRTGATVFPVDDPRALRALLER